MYDECKKYIKPTSNIIEVGAHIGTHTIPLSKLTQGYVFAFEMQRFIHQLLCTNITLNGVGNIITFREVVSNESKSNISVAELDYSPDRINTGNLKIQQIEKNNGFPIPKTTLDEKLKDIDNLDLIKVDVEGHELEVLQGSMNIIKNNKPVIITEYHTVKTKFTNGNQREIMNLFPNYNWKEVNGVYNLNNKEVHNHNMIGEPK